MKMKKSDLLVAAIALLLVGIFFLYMQVLAPAQAEIETLEPQNKTLTDQYNDLYSRSSQSALRRAQRTLTEQKGLATELAGSTLSGSMKNTIIQNTKKFLTTDEVLTPLMTITSSSYGAIASKKIVITSATGSRSTFALNECELSIEIELTAGNAAKAEVDFRTIIDRLIDSYDYIVVESYTFNPYTVDSAATANLNLKLLILPIPLTTYAVGSCPALLEDGTTCGCYNEFTDTECYDCGALIDNCPSCNTLLLYDEQSQQIDCTFCGSLLKRCSECGEYKLVSDAICSKCGLRDED